MFFLSFLLLIYQHPAQGRGYCCVTLLDSSLLACSRCAFIHAISSSGVGSGPSSMPGFHPLRVFFFFAMGSPPSRFLAAKLWVSLQHFRAAALVDLHHIRYKGIGCIALCVGFYALGNTFFYAAALFPGCKACAVV